MDAHDLTLTLSPQRLDYIAQVLSQRPYAEVAAVLDDIRAQVARQQALPVAPNGRDTADPAPH